MSNSIALITGASSGIGASTAEKLASAGFDLILVARRQDRLINKSKKLAKKFGIEVLSIALDVCDRAAVETAISNLLPKWKNIDVLINSAGLGIGREPIQKGSPDDWDITIDTNIKGLLYVTRTILHLMTKRKSGHIVNIGSISGLQAYPNGNVYSATKYAVRALSDNMRIDLLPEHIKVTTINPGRVQTEFMEVMFKGDKKKVEDIGSGFESLAAADVAEAILFAVTRPSNVVIAELTIVPKAQADCNNLLRT